MLFSWWKNEKHVLLGEETGGDLSGGARRTRPLAAAVRSHTGDAAPLSAAAHRSSLAFKRNRPKGSRQNAAMEAHRSQNMQEGTKP